EAADEQHGAEEGIIVGHDGDIILLLANSSELKQPKSMGKTMLWVQIFTQYSVTHQQTKVGDFGLRLLKAA
ncbi:MAG: hypothetical protein COS63_02020, partial [Anaerolineae bacterium CG06_land_8_20_14_3_00_57_67]